MPASVLKARGLSNCSSRALEHGSIAVAHRLSCSVACGISLDQGLNLCLLHWQADSLPLSHQGSPESVFSLRSVIQHAVFVIQMSEWSE